MGGCRRCDMLVAASTPELGSDDPVKLHIRIAHLEHEVKGPDGYDTWKDAAVAERVRRVKAEKELAAYKKAHLQC